MTQFEKFLYYHKAGVYLRGIMATLLFLFAIAILVRIFMPTQIITLRMLAALILTLVGIYLLSGEFGSLDENLAALHRKTIIMRIWNNVYNFFMTKGTFHLNATASQIPDELRFNAVFAGCNIYLPQEISFEIIQYRFAGRIQIVSLNPGQVSTPSKSSKSPESKKKKTNHGKNNKTKIVPSQIKQLRIYSFFSQVKIYQSQV